MQMYPKSNFYKLIFVIIPALIIACNSNSNNKTETEKPKTEAIPADLQSVSAAIEKDPENAELYYQRSVIYFREENANLALADINDAIKYDSLMPLYHYYKGRIAYSLNRTLEAEASYQKAIALKPDYEEAMMKLADLYLIVKEHQKSIDLYNTVIAQNKKNADAYFFRGMNLKELGDTSRAIASFQRAFEIDPDLYDATIQLGLILTARKDKAALEYLNAAIKLYPRSAEAYFARAYYYQLNKSYQKALFDYRKVIDIAPDNADAYYNVGVINMDVEQWREALRSFDICIQMNPQLIDAYYMRGKVQEKLNNKSEAIINYEYVVKSGVDFPEAEAALKRLRR